MDQKIDGAGGGASLRQGSNKDWKAKVSLKLVNDTKLFNFKAYFSKCQAKQYVIKTWGI